jgi:hypothetical protein
MRLAPHIYATTHGADDAAGAVAVKNAIAEALERRLAAGQIAGWEATAITTDEDWLEEGLLRDPIDAATGGGLPVVYVNVTKDEDDPRQSERDDSDLIEAFALRPVTVPDR